MKVGIIGGAGYTAGELIRLLVNHPVARIGFVNSSSHAGARIDSVHEGLTGECDLTFTADTPLESVDVLFLCMGHGKSAEFWQTHRRPEGLKVVDLSMDYRDESEGYVYGLPETQRERIVEADLVANPGCFATAIQLALAPLAAKGLIRSEVSVTAITGSTGAGVKPGPTTHFSWRTDNLSVYRALTHQHMAEIVQNLTRVGGGNEPAAINFVPVRGDFARGIFCITHLDCDLPEDEVRRIYEDFYATAKFTFVASQSPDLKQVVNTNKALVCPERHGGKLVVVSVIDNLLKGASGQAVQNMNLMMGLDECAGLHLKASAF